MKKKVMTCSKCGAAVTQPGACEACLPYNMYPTAWLAQHVGYEALRQLMLSHLPELRRMNFEQARMPLEQNDQKAIIDIFVAALPSGQPVVMLPCLDQQGYKSLVFSVKPSPLKDGQHRLRNFFGSN